MQSQSKWHRLRVDADHVSGGTPCNLLRASAVCSVGADFRVVLFFFFQAEDGIRDLTVTGVQTCALPILIPLHRFITIAALCTGAAQLIFLFNLIRSRFRGPKAPDNPWEATSLEWSTTSPPPFDNFGGRPPVVEHGPNEYGVDGGGRRADYVMQAAGAP